MLRGKSWPGSALPDKRMPKGTQALLTAWLPGNHLPFGPLHTRGSWLGQLVRAHSLLGRGWARALGKGRERGRKQQEAVSWDFLRPLTRQLVSKPFHVCPTFKIHSPSPSPSSVCITQSGRNALHPVVTQRSLMGK